MLASCVLSLVFFSVTLILSLTVTHSLTLTYKHTYIYTHTPTGGLVHQAQLHPDDGEAA